MKIEIDFPDAEVQDIQGFLQRKYGYAEIEDLIKLAIKEVAASQARNDLVDVMKEEE